MVADPQDRFGVPGQAQPRSKKVSLDLIPAPLLHDGIAERSQPLAFGCGGGDDLRRGAEGGRPGNADSLPAGLESDPLSKGPARRRAGAAVEEEEVVSEGRVDNLAAPLRPGFP